MGVPEGEDIQEFIDDMGAVDEDPKMVEFKKKYEEVYKGRIERNECTQCGVPMLKIQGGPTWGTYRTQCEHAKGLVFSSG